MTAFKKGDPVIWIADDWAAAYEWVGDDTPGPGIWKDTHGVYDDISPQSLYPWVRLEDGRRVVASRDALAPLAQWEVGLLSDEPAPLDPTLSMSDVEAGKRLAWTNSGIEVRSLGVENGAVVFQWDNGAQGQLPLSEVANYLQPAPEPEPEWKPGTLVSGEFEGRRDQGLVTEQGDFLFWNHTGGHMQEEPLPTVTNVKPLVVIDPAEVDVEALLRAYVKGYAEGLSSEPRRDGLRAVLESLGLAK